MKVTVYEWNAEVVSVTEVKRKINSKGIGDKHTFEEESLGWTVRISDSSAVGMFKNKPELNTGDTVVMTMAKKIV